MSSVAEDREIKVCCATFYQSDIVRMLFSDVFHPGGLALTRHLGEEIDLGPLDRVLDVACGRGASAVHLAKHFGCAVTGVDYGSEDIAAAEGLAAESGMTNLTTFRQGDAERLPFDDSAFDAAISECSFCTFPDKATAAAEMARVLRTGGRLGLTDIAVNGLLARRHPFAAGLGGVRGWCRHPRGLRRHPSGRRLRRLPRRRSTGCAAGYGSGRTS